MGQILSIPAVLLGFLFLGIAWKNRDKKQVVFTGSPTEEANRIQASVTHS